MRFGELPLDRFGAQRFVGRLQFLRALGDRLLEGLRASRLGLGLPARRGVLADRLDGNEAEENCAQADNDSEPAEIIGQAVGLGGEDLALLDPLAQCLLLGVGDFVQLARDGFIGLGLAGGIIIGNRVLALLGRGGSGSECQLRAALCVELKQLVDAPPLLGAGAQHPFELADLVPGKPPLAVIDAAAVLHVLVEHEAAERGFGAGHAGIDAADQQGDVVGAPLGFECAFAGVVGQCDEDHHDHQDQGRNQAPGRRSAAAPVEVQLVPRRHHGVSLDPYAAPRKPGQRQFMQPVARPAAANMPRISPTCSLLCSEHREQRSRVIPAGVAGGRARLT